MLIHYRGSLSRADIKSALLSLNPKIPDLRYLSVTKTPRSVELTRFHVSCLKKRPNKLIRWGTMNGSFIISISLKGLIAIGGFEPPFPNKVVV